MRVELGDATGKFSAVVKDVSEVIGPDLATLRADVAELRGVVDTLVGEDEAEVEPEEPRLHWPDLTTAVAEEEWEALGKWVHTTLGYWYEVTRGQLPDCWPLHRPAFLQVWWLRLSYDDAHTGSRASSVNMAEWNTRWLDAALERIAAAIPSTMCRAVPGAPGQHLVPAHEAQQQAEAARAPRATAPAGGGQYSIPSYMQAQQQAQRVVSPPQTSVPGEPQPVPADKAKAASSDVTDPRYWGEFFEQARRADLQWRHERDRAAAAAEQQANQAP